MLENSTEDGSFIATGKICDLVCEEVNTLSELMIHITEEKKGTPEVLFPLSTK